MSGRPSLADFVFTEKLGSGSYSTVYKAYRRVGARQVVAIKCVEKSSLSKTAVDNLVNEIALLKKLNHDHIVNMKDFQWDTNYIYIIMEYCSGGDLSKFIQSKRCLPEKIVQRFLQQLGKALEYLRKQNISHMDLKPQNILLTSSGEHSILKLADFGFAQSLRPHEDATSMRGSPLYMAPEILLCHRYDARVDLWSVGVILYECLFGRAPYSSKSFAELAEKIKNKKPIDLPYNCRVTSECRDLLLRLLQRDPDSRISFEEFFTHPFLDLEHTPSTESYNKAVALVTEAVEMDRQNKVVEAIRLYCDATQYFMPIMDWESNLEKKAALRSRITQYIRRAEELKEQLRPTSKVPKASNTALPYQQLIEMCSDNVQITAAIRIVQEAERLIQTANEENYREAYSKLMLALETLVPWVTNDEPKGSRYDLMHSHVQRWVQEAESIKDYLAASTPPKTTSPSKPDEPATPETSSKDEDADLSYSRQCLIQ